MKWLASRLTWWHTTKVFLEHLPWLPVIQPYEDYGLQKHVEFTPNPNQQFEAGASISGSVAPSRRQSPRSRPPGPPSRPTQSYSGLVK